MPRFTDQERRQVPYALSRIAITIELVAGKWDRIHIGLRRADLGRESLISARVTIFRKKSSGETYVRQEEEVDLPLHRWLDFDGVTLQEEIELYTLQAAWGELVAPWLADYGIDASGEDYALTFSVVFLGDNWQPFRSRRPLGGY